MNPLAEPLRRCLAALSDDYAAHNDPALLAKSGTVAWDWNLRIMRDAQAALEAAGERPCAISQDYTAKAMMDLPANRAGGKAE